MGQVANVSLRSPKQWLEQRGALNLHPEMSEMVDRLVMEPDEPLQGWSDCLSINPVPRVSIFFERRDLRVCV
jgi:hypothetical protein